MMTHQDAQATSDVATGTIQIHTLFANALIDPNSTHSFVSISFVGLLGMLVGSLNFDLIDATPMGGYREMLVDLVLLITY